MKKGFLFSSVLFSVSLAACLISVNGASAAERNEIRVGAVNAMTGGEAMTGAEQKWAYEQAVADINKKGGVYVKEAGRKLPMKLIFADDKSAPDQAAAAMERLIKADKIDFGLSTDDVQKNIAAGTVADKYKVFFIVNQAWLNMIESQNFKWVAAYFFTTSIAAKVPFQIWNGLAEADKIKRPALIMTDNLGGQSFGKGFREWGKQFGYTFAVDESYPVGSKDFSSLVLKMKTANADAMLFLGAPADGITLLRQMKDSQLKLRYIHGWAGFWPTEFASALGNDADYVVHDGFWTENNSKPGSKELGQRFKKQFGKDSVNVGHHYANPQILAMAIEKAGSLDSAKVRDVVFGGEFKDTVIGDVKFDAKGLAVTDSIALQWWKGERMPVWPPVKSIWKLKMIPVD